MDYPNDILGFASLLLLGLLGLVMLYRMLPFRKPGASKPRIALFPKYRIRLTRFLSSAEVERRLRELGFTRIRSNGDTMRFVRGFVLGDLSLKWIKVRLELTRQGMGNEPEIRLAAAYLIFFDTGDLWLLSRDVLGALHAKEEVES